jgi:hypothetical protein
MNKQGERSEVLKLHGNEVATVFGSGAAKLVSGSQSIVTHSSLHAAAEEERCEIFEWLQANHPLTCSAISYSQVIPRVTKAGELACSIRRGPVPARCGENPTL